MDLFLTQFIVNLQNIKFIKLFLIITYLGDILTILSLSAFLLIFLIWRVKYLEAIFFSSAIIFSGLTIQALKLFFSRSRPNFSAIIIEDSFSFPSGHALIATVFYGFLIYLIFKHNRQRWIKITSAFFLIILILAIGFSRVYLGVHWVSDVAVGWFIGGLVLAGIIKIKKKIE